MDGSGRAQNADSSRTPGLVCAFDHLDDPLLSKISEAARAAAAACKPQIVYVPPAWHTNNQPAEGSSQAALLTPSLGAPQHQNTPLPPLQLHTVDDGAVAQAEAAAGPSEVAAAADYGAHGSKGGKGKKRGKKAATGLSGDTETQAPGAAQQPVNKQKQQHFYTAFFITTLLTAVLDACKKASSFPVAQLAALVEHSLNEAKKKHMEEAAGDPEVSASNQTAAEQCDKLLNACKPGGGISPASVFEGVMRKASG